MSRERISFCISSVGGALVPSALTMLRQSIRFDYRLIGTNSGPAPLAESLLDALYAVPRGDHPAYPEALMEVVRKERPDVLLPWSDEEAEAISKLKDELEILGCRAMVSSPECLARISNKRVTYDHLRAAGLPVPDYTSVYDVAGLREAISAYLYPSKTVVVKPSRGRGGRGLKILLGEDAPPGWLGSGKRELRIDRKHFEEFPLTTLFECDPEVLVMPCLEEPAFDVDVITFGRDPAVILRRRHNPTGIPFAGNTLISNKGLHDYCHAVAKCLGLEAIHDIDMMTGMDGYPLVLEVNPRPSGSIPAAMAAGFPVLDWAVDRILGNDPITTHPSKEIVISEDLLRI